MARTNGCTFDLVAQKERNERNQAEAQKQGTEFEAEKRFVEFDLDVLHEHNLKIFGDVFESLIGAVFLDSQSVEITWDVLHRLVRPYVYIYADLATL